MVLNVGTDTCPHDNGIVRALNSNYRPNERVVGNAKHTIFVGRLNLKTDEVIYYKLKSKQNYYPIYDYYYYFIIGDNKTKIQTIRQNNSLSFSA